MSISARQSLTGSVEARQSVSGEVTTPVNTSVIYRPSVSEDGILSWTNDIGLPNPDPVDISGPTGDPGYTPVKGTDYYTESEKAELVSEIAEQTKDEWIDLADITLEEAVTYIAFNKDVNGQTFSVKKLVALVSSPQVLSGTFYASDATNIYSNYLGNYIGDNLSGNVQKIYITFEVVEGKFAEIKVAYNTSSDTFYGDITHKPQFIQQRSTKPISRFYLGKNLDYPSGEFFPVGTVIKVWGLKV